MDRHDELLISNVLVTREVAIPPQTETAIFCEVTARKFNSLRLKEGHPNKLPVETSLNGLRNKGQVIT